MKKESYHLPMFSEFNEAQLVKPHKGEKPPTEKQIAGLEKKMEEYLDVSSQIDQITLKYERMLMKELKNLPSKQEKLVKDIKKDVEKLKIQTIKSKGVMVKFRQAYKQTRIGYKDAWEAAIVKVSDDARKVMEKMVSKFASVTTAKGKVVLTREGKNIDEGISAFIDKAKDFLKQGAEKLVNMFSSAIKQAMNALPSWAKSTDDVEKLTKKL